MKEDKGEYQKVYIPDFYVVGISVRTSNENGRAALDLGHLWSRFYDEDIAGMIEDRESDDIYSVYTDYESDFRGEYTCILGVRVGVIVNIPEGMVGRKIEGGDFLKVVVRGSMPGALFAAWNGIWQDDEMLDRKYGADFEVYGDSATEGEQAMVEIFLSVKGQG